MGVIWLVAALMSTQSAADEYRQAERARKSAFIELDEALMTSEKNGMLREAEPHFERVEQVSKAAQAAD